MKNIIYLTACVFLFLFVTSCRKDSIEENIVLCNEILFNYEWAGDQGCYEGVRFAVYAKATQSAYVQSIIVRNDRQLGIPNVGGYIAVDSKVLVWEGWLTAGQWIGIGVTTCAGGVYTTTDDPNICN
jgi:hypothetical protein